MSENIAKFQENMTNFTNENSVKEYETDKKLTEFVNNYPEKFNPKVMFKKEEEGVYLFGTKKVALKV